MKSGTRCCALKQALSTFNVKTARLQRDWAGHVSRWDPLLWLENATERMATA